MNQVSRIDKILADEEKFYLASIPNTVIEALKKRKCLPKKLYVHWTRLHALYYAVTLGNTKGQNKNPLNEDNTTELPEKIANEIQHEEEIANMEATAISWKISHMYGRTVAFAKILIGHDKKFEAKIKNNELILTPELKYFMNLHVRTRLYWKRIEENVWLITKTPLREPDGITWHVCNTLTIPPKFFEDMHYFIGWNAELWLQTINDKPVILLYRKVFRTPVDAFFEERLVKSEKDIEIHELYNKYLEFINDHQFTEEVKVDFDFFLKLLEYSQIISPEAHALIKEKPNEPFYIHGFDFKPPLERGDDG